MNTTRAWTPISRAQHAAAGWLSYQNYHHAATATFSPLLAAELARVNGVFPICFVQQDEGYQLVALHSLQPSLNLYMNSQGQWTAPYIPAWHRSHPFRLLKNDASDDQILCVDESSPLFQEEATGDTKRFFDADGKPTPELQQTLDFLQECNHNRILTDKLVQRLADAGLIQPWPLQLQSHDGKPLPVNGLFHINETALQQLSGDTLATLAVSGALSIAYAQLLSADRIREFEQRYQQREQEQAVSNAPDLDALFGEDGGDTLKFGL